MKKNCHNCVYLEFYEEDPDYSPGYYPGFYCSGFYCDYRQYRNEKDERVHLIKLDDPAYRNTSKKCCELKVAK